MANPASTTDLEEAQAKVHEVVEIMQVNIEKVLERDEKLNDLDKKATILMEGGQQFEQQSKKLQRKFCLRNAKFIIIISAISAVILIVIIVVVVNNSSSGDKKN